VAISGSRAFAANAFPIRIVSPPPKAISPLKLVQRSRHIFSKSLAPIFDVTVKSLVMRRVELPRFVLTCASRVGEPKNGGVIDGEPFQLSIDRGEIACAKTYADRSWRVHKTKMRANGIHSSIYETVIILQATLLSQVGCLDDCGATSVAPWTSGTTRRENAMS
jgi:hypothetical protein